jgi:hypothetical protein
LQNTIGNDVKNVDFCDQEETIQHMFILCPFANIIWNIVHMAFNIAPPKKLQIYLELVECDGNGREIQRSSWCMCFSMGSTPCLE